jgi:hypothetical protein
MPKDATPQKEEAAETENKFESEERPVAPGWLFDNIAEASKNARKIYFVYISFLAYGALTVVSTSDRQIILNESVNLPILKLNVSFKIFFILAPLMAILFFIYFQLYLQRLRTLLHYLENDYVPVEKKRLYPWIITIAEDPEPGFIGFLQKIIVAFSLWFLLPAVLFVFPLYYLKKHDPMVGGRTKLMY